MVSAFCFLFFLIFCQYFPRGFTCEADKASSAHLAPLEDRQEGSCGCPLLVERNLYLSSFSIIITTGRADVCLVGGSDGAGAPLHRRVRASPPTPVHRFLQGGVGGACEDCQEAQEQHLIPPSQQSILPSSPERSSQGCSDAINRLPLCFARAV